MRTLMIALLIALPSMTLAAPTETITLEVSRMTCPVYPITVKKALQQVDGVTDVAIDFDSKTATVSFDPDKAQPEDLTQATTDAGYPSTPQTQKEQPDG